MIGARREDGQPSPGQALHAVADLVGLNVRRRLAPGGARASGQSGRQPSQSQGEPTPPVRPLTAHQPRFMGRPQQTFCTGAVLAHRGQ